MEPGAGNHGSFGLAEHLLGWPKRRLEQEEPAAGLGLVAGATGFGLGIAF